MEYAALGLPSLPYLGEETLKTNKERSLRCINGLLERRAAILGSKFAEFRNAQSSNDVSAALLDRLL
jgi:hypothetical protein